MTIKQYMDDELPMKELEEFGFFKKGMTTEQKAERVCKFFGLKTIYEYSHLKPFGKGLFNCDKKAINCLKLNDN